MAAADLAAVCRLAATSMANPWSARQFASELDITGVRLVADTGKICGVVFFRTIAPEAEMLQLAVDPSCRRRGIGSQLLRQGMRQLAGQGVQVCFLEVRRRNRGARNFYRQAGFMQIARRRKYYHCPEDDAVILKKILDGVRSDANHS